MSNSQHESGVKERGAPIVKCYLFVGMMAENEMWNANVCATSFEVHFVVCQGLVKKTQDKLETEEDKPMKNGTGRQPWRKTAPASLKLDVTF